MDSETQKALKVFYALQKELQKSDDTIRLKQVNQIIAVLESDFYHKVGDIHKTLKELNKYKDIQPDDIEVNKVNGSIAYVPESPDKAIKRGSLGNNQSGRNKYRIPASHEEFQRRVEAICDKDRELAHVQINKTKSDQPLGFSVKCSQPNKGIFVEAVATGGIAQECDIRPHDQILAVDGIPLDNPDTNREVALEALRSNHTRIDLRIAKAPTDTRGAQQNGTLSALSPHDNQGHMRNRSDIGLVRELTTEWTQYEIIDLETRNGSFGFGITAGLKGGVMVRTILNGGSADQDGRLQINDHIMYINDKSVRHMSNNQVAEILKTHKHHVKLIVARPFDQKSQVPSNGGRVQMVETVNLDDTLRMIVSQLYPPTHNGITPPQGYMSGSEYNQSMLSADTYRDSSEDIIEQKTVILPRSEAHLGMTVSRIFEPDTEYRMTTLDGVFVKKVIPNSIADRCGIQKFDKIIEINGQRIETENMDQGVHAILDSNNDVQVEILRYVSGPTQLKLFEAVLANDDLDEYTDEYDYDDNHSSDASSIDSDSYYYRANNINKHPSPLKPEERKQIVQKWKKELGNENARIIVSEFSKFSEEGGIGLSLEGTVDVDEQGHELHPHHYIRSILPTGPAGRNKILKEHDELLEANDTRVHGLNHMDVVDVLKKLSISVRIVCLRGDKNNSITNDKQKPHLNQRGNSADYMSDGTLEKEAERLCRDFDEMIARESGGPIQEPIGGTGALSAASGVSKSMYSMKAKSEDDGLNEWGKQDNDNNNQRSISLNEVQGLAMWDTEITYVELDKKSSGLGFSILDYQDSINPNSSVIVIRSLVPNGPAAKDGRIFPGDRLMFINDIDVSKATMMEAVEALKSTKEGLVRLGIVKAICLDKNSGNDENNNSKANNPSKVGIQSPRVKDNEDESPINKLPDTKNKENDANNLEEWTEEPTIIVPEALEQKVKITKLAGQKLGITLDSESMSTNNENGFVIRQIEKGSVVEKSTKLEVGDLVTKLNDDSVRNITIVKLQEVLHRINLSAGNASIRYIPGSDFQIFVQSQQLQNDVRS